MFVKDVMTSPAVTVSGDASVKEALCLLDRHRVTALPVVDSRGCLLGIVSEADLLRDAVRQDDRTHLTPHMPSGAESRNRPAAVRDVMSTLSMTVSPASDLSDAVEVMTTTAVKSLPVVEADHVVGVVSRSDVVHVLARSDEQICTEIDELLRSADLQFDVEVKDGLVSLEGPSDPRLRRVAEVIAGSVRGVLSVELR